MISVQHLDVGHVGEEEAQRGHCQARREHDEESSGDKKRNDPAVYRLPFLELQMYTVTAGRDADGKGDGAVDRELNEEVEGFNS